MQTVSYFGYVLYLPTAQGRRNLIFLHAFHRHPPPRAAEALYCMCLPLAQRRRNLLLAAQGHRDLVFYLPTAAETLYFAHHPLPRAQNLRKLAVLNACRSPEPPSPGISHAFHRPGPPKRRILHACRRSEPPKLCIFFEFCRCPGPPRASIEHASRRPGPPKPRMLHAFGRPGPPRFRMPHASRRPGPTKSLLCYLLPVAQGRRVGGFCVPSAALGRRSLGFYILPAAQSCPRLVFYMFPATLRGQNFLFSRKTQGTSGSTTTGPRKAL